MDGGDVLPWARAGFHRFLHIHRYVFPHVLCFLLIPPQGTALYVYFILSNDPTDTGLVSDAYCDFIMDGVTVGSFTHTTDGSFKFQYNVLVYHTTGLSNGPHSFTISTEGATDSYVIFDYAKYSCVLFLCCSRGFILTCAQ